jgi:hypothetical protein
MRRRDFIAGLMFAAATGRAQAQQTGKVCRIVAIFGRKSTPASHWLYYSDVHETVDLDCREARAVSSLFLAPDWWAVIAPQACDWRRSPAITTSQNSNSGTAISACSSATFRTDCATPPSLSARHRRCGLVRRRRRTAGAALPARSAAARRRCHARRLAGVPGLGRGANRRVHVGDCREPRVMANVGGASTVRGVRHAGWWTANTMKDGRAWARCSTRLLSMR